MKKTHHKKKNIKSKTSHKNLHKKRKHKKLTKAQRKVIRKHRRSRKQVHRIQKGGGAGFPHCMGKAFVGSPWTPNNWPGSTVGGANYYPYNENAGTGGVNLPINTNIIQHGGSGMRNLIPADLVNFADLGINTIKNFGADFTGSPPYVSAQPYNQFGQVI
jgi:hypothetical protein